MKTIDYSYFIERYLSGEMDHAEREWFEKELEGNDALKSEIMLRKKTDEVLANQEILNLRMKLKTIKVAREEKETIKIVSKKAILRSAAVITILVVLGASFLITFKNQPPEAIYEKSFTIYNPGGIVRTAESDNSSIGIQYRKALDLYNKGEYELAIANLKEYLLSRPEHIEALLIYGIASIQTNNYDVAEESFRKIINDGNNLYIDNARWYLALSLMKSGDSEKAKTELNNIVESNSIYARKAKQILRKLR